MARLPRKMAGRGPRRAAIGGKARPEAETGAETPRVSAEEAAAAFAHAVTPETYLAVHDEVLRRWDFTCAMTGRRMLSGTRPHPDLEIVAIRPLELGGPLHASNFLPLVPAAALALRAGHIVIDDDFGLWAGLARIDPELVDSVVPLGRLILPERFEERPDLDHIRWHRARALGVPAETA